MRTAILVALIASGCIGPARAPGPPTDRVVAPSFSVLVPAGYEVHYDAYGGVQAEQNDGSFCGGFGIHVRVGDRTPGPCAGGLDKIVAGSACFVGSEDGGSHCHGSGVEVELDRHVLRVSDVVDEWSDPARLEELETFARITLATMTFTEDEHRD